MTVAEVPMPHQNASVWAHASEQREVCILAVEQRTFHASAVHFWMDYSLPFICPSWEVWITAWQGQFWLMDTEWNKTEKLLSSSFCFPCWFRVSAFTKLENSALHLYFCQVLNTSPGFSLTNLVQPVSISVSHEIKFSVWERNLNLGHITSHFTPEHKTCFLLLDPASFVRYFLFQVY